ncbi:MAG: transaldolase, partial [Planctomycetaceae bacterium]|nr:transaldolase [Planctomycetaceae bacterium]
MTTPLESLVASGTKLWLDSVDPDFVKQSRSVGATGATSNPVIISGLINSGRFDDELQELSSQHTDDGDVAWQLTDRLVQRAQEVFADVWEETGGNNGYVSFELDPLLEAEDCPLSTAERTARYIELGKQWAEGHSNRMIKVPATPAGLAALEELAASGVTLNVTLIFSQ